MPKIEQQGFSLLEIVIAFSILALALGILLNIFSKGAQTAVMADDYTAAIQIAESHLAAVGIEEPLQAGETTGEEDEKFGWTITVTPFQFIGNPNAAAAGQSVDSEEQSTVQLYKVKVSVLWDDDRQLELVTLKMAVKNNAL